MKKFTLAGLAILLSVLGGFAQKSKKAEADTALAPKKLSLEEVNFVSSYYGQDGSHSAVAGGIGSEKLTDFGNSIELKWSGVSLSGRRHAFDFSMGADHYTSASSDKIDPTARQRGGPGGGPGGPGGGGPTTVDSALLASTTIQTSASYKDTRLYPSASWSIENPKKGASLTFSASYSTEWDYRSKGAGLAFSKKSKDKSREFSARGQVFLDRTDQILPIELSQNNGGPGGGPGGRGGRRDWADRKSFEADLVLSQIINRKLQVAVLADFAIQNGQLATTFQRVFSTDGTVRRDSLPSRRVKIPVGLRVSYFASEKVVLRGFLRAYGDSWGVKAVTSSLEAPIKITPFCSLSPFVRAHFQHRADYFGAYRTHATGDQYATSDYDLSTFRSLFFGTGLRWAPARAGLIESFSMIELRGGIFRRSDGLRAFSLAANFRFK